MSLNVAANVARQSLLVSQNQIALSGRNVAAASDPTRSRAIGLATTTADGGVHLSGIRRAEDLALFTRMIKATSAAAEQDAMLAHLKVLADTVGDPQDGVSPAALVGDLQAALAEYANAPDDPLFGQTAIETARDLADALNRAANELNLLRESADREMGSAVEELNRLLGEFDKANTAIVKATSTGDDATMWQDRRDAIVAEMSEYIGITTMQRENGDVALFTDSGITLFDKVARDVSFTRTPVYTVDTIGGTVFVDGLAVTGDDATMPLRSGSIAGHAQIRDNLAPTYRLQLDEIARTLTEIFEDGTGSLFINAGGPDYAGTIAVAPDVDPSQGGAVENLRDGTGNPSGYAAFAERLLQLGEDLTAIQTFDTDAQITASGTLQNFATASVGWLEELRSNVSAQSTTERAILARTSDALSRATGINMDDEYAMQLEIERNYAASSRLIMIIDEMFDTLLRVA
ncbi:flagellar hook-associated protein FlgK [Acuticoccus sp. M5D2P5]|uniref:flagellar hook-associated protein FlgK n=1 Tax=Acuticoccus kalidii TaxID=2910977 RepID=UPI001F3560FE|nr:flagellar hook-associated protein FlgK [Acuticoccus kalidii]MCF3932485.1 flagellar hook-associated protein FlgK [Acuticoccus kalidii]